MTERRSTSRSLGRILGATGVVLINGAVAALLVWVTAHPLRPYGPPATGPDYSTLPWLMYPGLNLGALYVASYSSRARFVSGIYYINVLLAAVAALNGFASCVALTYSGIEKLVTVVTLTPRLITSLGLRQYRNA